MSRLRTGVPPRPNAAKKARHNELEAFVAGAPRKETLPWKEPQVRDDLYLQVNMKQPESLVLKVEWLAQLKGITKREAVETALSQWTERELSQLGIKE